MYQPGDFLTPPLQRLFQYPAARCGTGQQHGVDHGNPRAEQQGEGTTEPRLNHPVVGYAQAGKVEQASIENTAALRVSFHKHIEGDEAHQHERCSDGERGPMSS